MSILSPQQIEQGLKALEGWAYSDGALRKRFKLPSFRDAVAFVDRVADLAEAADHHPDIFINYNRVTLTLVTHSEGGVTEKDLSLASQIAGLLQPR